MAYLRGHYEPEDEVNEVRMKHRTRNNKIINNQLYKQGICEPLLKCISAEEGKELLSEIHEGNLWHTSRHKSHGRKSISTRILLALSPK